jgi:hypothetical protein
VVLGKANMDEWSNFRSLHGTDGWKALTLKGKTADQSGITWRWRRAGG